MAACKFALNLRKIYGSRHHAFISGQNIHTEPAIMGIDRYNGISAAMIAIAASVGMMVFELMSNLL